MAKSDEPRFRLRPRKPPSRSERAGWTSAYKTLMHYARMSRNRKRRAAGLSTTKQHPRPYMQRCAVRIMYSKNIVGGKWRAHGRYVARESATHEGDPRTVGFDARGEAIDISERLEGWQKAGDERLWKSVSYTHLAASVPPIPSLLAPAYFPLASPLSCLLYTSRCV